MEDLLTITLSFSSSFRFHCIQVKTLAGHSTIILYSHRGNMMVNLKDHFMLTVDRVVNNVWMNYF